MIANILHNSNRQDRLPILVNELETQGISQYRLWDNIYAPSIIKSINKGHKQIVEYAKQEGLPEVLIMEDDVKFLGNGAFKYFIDNKPAVYDIYLASIFLGILSPENTVKEFTGMTCYIVHQNFYNTFLNADEKIHIDAALSFLGKYIVCNPFVAIQHNGYSDNAQSHQNYDAIFKERNLFNQK